MEGSRLRELDKIDKVESSLSQKRITWNNLLRYNRTMFYAWKKRKTDLDTIRSPLLIQSFRERKTTRKTEGWERDSAGKRNFEKSDFVRRWIRFRCKSSTSSRSLRRNPSRGLYRTLATNDNAVPSSLIWSKTDRHRGKHNVYSNRVPLSLSLSKEGKKRKRRKRKINELALVQIDAKRFE